VELEAGRRLQQRITSHIPNATRAEGTYARGPGFCCVCGQPVYRLDWHVDLWDAGANKNAHWHGGCVIWNAPSGGSD
jgi:hypothetical protein